MKDEANLSLLAGRAMVACANLENAIYASLPPSSLEQLKAQIAATSGKAGMEILSWFDGTPTIALVLIHPNGVREPMYEMLLPEKEPTARH